MIGILPCAGKGTKFYELGKEYPKCILPYKEKPLLIYNVDWLKAQGCNQVYIITSHQESKIQEVLKIYNTDAITLKPLTNEGLSVSVLSALSNVGNESALILLGDMIVEESIPSDTENWVAINRVKDWSRWCMFDEKKNLFIEKPNNKPDTDIALTGIYFVKQAINLKKAIQEQLRKKIKVQNEYTLSSALQLMNEKFIAHEIKTLDFGSVEKFFENRKVKQSRVFNSIQYDGNIAIKRSKQRHKLINEVSWYNNVPIELQAKTPKIFGCSFYGEEASYEMQKVNLPTLRELFLFLDRGEDLWGKILNACVSTYKQMVSYQYEYSSFDFILEKTKARSKGLDVGNFLGEFEELGRKIDTTTHLMHGDYIPSNLFWNTQSEDIVLIDPRGELFGSKYYDWAKLKHSFNYYYDFIDAELYAKHGKKIKIFNDGCEAIEKMFNKWERKLFNEQERKYLEMLTASLFLSEIPLHSHNKNNQKIYYDIFKSISDLSINE